MGCRLVPQSLIYLITSSGGEDKVLTLPGTGIRFEEPRGAAASPQVARWVCILATHAPAKLLGNRVSTEAGALWEAPLLA